MRHAGFKTKEPEKPASKAKAATRSAPGALRIGDPNDAREREADRVAEEIVSSRAGKKHWSLSGMSLAATPLQRKCSCGGSGGSTSECDECKQKKDEQTLQRKSTGAAAPATAPPIVHEVLNSPGQPLDRATRDFFEPRFGQDLGDVRMHTDAHAGQSAQTVSASAYTVGSDVVFGPGASPHQKPLLAHELAHVVQQSGSPAAVMASEGASLEAEAEHTASAISGGSSFANIHARSAPRISRQVPPAPVTSPVLSFLTPQDIAKLQGFGNADYQSSLDTLEKMMRITGDVTQDGLPRQFVSTRQASGELRTFLDFARNPDVQALKVVPSAQGGRSPDFYYRHVSGAESRVEVVNITAASKVARAELRPTPGGGTARRIPQDQGNVVTPVEEIDSVAKLRNAISVKVKAGSQLSAQNPNTQAGGQPMQVGGEVRVSTSHIELSRAEIDGVIGDLRNELANSSANRIVVDTIDSAEPRAGRKLFEYVRDENNNFSFSQTRVSFARQSPAPSTPVPAAPADTPGAGSTPQAEAPSATPSTADVPPPTASSAADVVPGATKGAVAEGATEGAVTEGAVKGAAKSAVAEGSVAEGAVAGGLAEGSIAGAALGAIASMAVTVAVALLANWALVKLFELALEADVEDFLTPALEKKLKELQPKLAALQGTKKLYVRVTYDFTFQRDTSDADPLMAAPPFYEPGSIRLVNVHPGNEELDFPSSSEDQSIEVIWPHRRERAKGRQSYSVLIDDAPKRRREAETKKAVESLSKAKPSKPVAPPPTPPLQPAPKPFTPLPVPAPPTAPSVQFLSPPGGPAQEPRVEEMVAYYKAQAINLKSRGERLLSTSSSKDEINAFLNDEAIWRNQVTVWDNHYIEKGPEFGHRGMDELRNSDEFGGRLKQIRKNLGG